MVYRLAADGVLLLHLAFVLFVVGGGFLVRRTPRLAWLHLPAAAWGAVVEFAGWVCPLTPLEHFLRQRGETANYDEDFITHYLLSILYPSALTREVQIVLGAAVLAVNLAIYWRLVRRHYGPRP